MFVDDERDVLLSFEKTVTNSSKDYEFIGARSGEECLELIKDGKIPDVIYLDIMMPGLSGWEVYDKIRENPAWNHIPIVFLTARTDQVAVKVGEALGDGYIEKPIDSTQLLQHIDNILVKNKS
jgi:CheY-like chemotaxis protein